MPWLYLVIDTKMNIIMIFLLLTFAVPSNSSTAPRKTFKTFWNIPSEKCLKRGIHIPLETYDFTFNQGETFFGDQINVFYEKQFGKVPYFKNYDPKQPVNGGLPQLGDLNEHLRVVRENVTTRIPDEHFDGVAMIDLEQWRPLFDFNWGAKSVYKNESIALVRRNKPKWNESRILMRARKDFNKAAREFFLKTIELCRQLRPYAFWGFYGFPYCNYDVGEHGENTCSSDVKLRNNLLQFITSSGNALFPSIYLSDRHSRNNLLVQAILEESKRVAEFSAIRLPVFPYTKFEYDPFNQSRKLYFYIKRDLCNTAKQAADYGASGVVFWTTSYKLETRCTTIENYVKTVLGPIMVRVQTKFSDCAARVCENQGRCVIDTPQTRCQLAMKIRNYHCECDPGFTGPSCNIPLPLLQLPTI